MKFLTIRSGFSVKGSVNPSFKRKTVTAFPHAHALSLFQYALDNEFNIPISMSQQVELLNIVSVIPDQQKFSSARFIESLNATIRDGKDLNQLLDTFFSSSNDATGEIASKDKGATKNPTTLKDEIRTSILKTLSSRLSSNVFKAIDTEGLNSIYSSECHMPEVVMMIRTLFDLSAAFRSSQAGGDLKNAIDKVQSAQAAENGNVQSHIRSILNYFKSDVTPTVPGNGLHFLKYLDADNADVFDGDKWASHELSVNPIKLSFESVMQALDYILLGVRLHGKDPYGAGGSTAVSLQSLLEKDVEVIDISSLLRPVDFSGTSDFDVVRKGLKTPELDRFIRISYKKWLMKIFKDGFPMSDMRPAYVKEDDHALIAQISLAYAESRATADLLSIIVSDLLEYANEFKKLLSSSDEDVCLHADVIVSFMNRMKHMTDDSSANFLDHVFARFDKLIEYNPTQLAQNGISLTFAPTGALKAASALYNETCHIGLCKLETTDEKWKYDIEFLNRWQARKISDNNFYPQSDMSSDLIEWPPYNWPLEAQPIDEFCLKAVITSTYEYGLYPLLAKFSAIFTCKEYSPKIKGLRDVDKTVFDTLANAGSIKMVTLTRKRDLYNLLNLPEIPMVTSLLDAMFKGDNAFPAIVGISDTTVITRMLSLEDEVSLDRKYVLLNEVGRSLFPDNLAIASVYALDVVPLDNKLIVTGKEGDGGKGKGKGKFGKKKEEEEAKKKLEEEEKKKKEEEEATKNKK